MEASSSRLYSNATSIFQGRATHGAALVGLATLFVMAALAWRRRRQLVPLPEPVQNKSTYRVALYTRGTRGDVEPILALAKGLQKRGHKCVVIAPDQFERFVETCGLDFLKANIDYEQPAFFSTAKTLPELIAGCHTGASKDLTPRYGDVAQALHDHLIVWKPDLVVSNEFGLRIALDVQDKLGFKIACTKMCPAGMTKFRPPFGDERETKWFFRMAFLLKFLAVVRAAKRFKLTESQNAFRAKIGLGPVTIQRLRDGGKGLLTLFVFDETLYSRPKDWPQCHPVVGFLRLRSESLPMSDELRNFCSHDGPTIVVTFGSMSTLDVSGSNLVERCVEAALSAHDSSRVVLVLGWLAPRRDERDRVMVVESVPYDQLFPIVDCVIYHGGAGTTAAVVEAGARSVVVPILLWADQRGWANAIEDQGLGVRVNQGKEATKQELETAVRHVLEDEGIHITCKNAAARVSENSSKAVDLACEWLVERDIAPDFCTSASGQATPEEVRSLRRSSVFY